MATKYGRIDSAESSFEEQAFHKGQTLISSSLGVHHHFAIRNCRSEDPDAACSSDPGAILNTSGIHHAFVHTMFYSSGSSYINTDEKEKFNSIYHNFNQYNDLKPFHTNKFYDSASIFYIPQAYFGQRIQPGSFQLIARTGSFANKTKQILIKDDNNGNLYSTNPSHTQSIGEFSSSQNYIGNVYYDLGIAVLTETGSWSGSVSYFDIGSPTDHGFLGTMPDEERDYRYWTIKCNSTTPIFTSQFSIKINGGDFNHTTNYSARGEISGSGLTADVTGLGNLKNDLTGSGWSPYFNQIQLFRNNNGEEPLLIANLPRSVKMRDDIDLIVTFRVDH